MPAVSVPPLSWESGNARTGSHRIKALMFSSLEIL